jgi:hypothetical protein
MLNNFFTFSRFVLFIALCISAIAAYYSVIGLTAIFAGAVIPIIVMGAILEIAKITTTVWLHKYWNRAAWSIKLYLTAAVIALAFLTSMGIFGLLSKAHSDTGLVSGDVAAKVALIDEKIKTQRDNIDTARRALQQMDEQVNQRMSRSDSEQSAERSVQIRRQQSAERTKLQKEIGEAQTIIAKLNEERAPISASQRKVEAEVGPIKYIAALIYGDNPDTNLLERAVRWVIIMIVIVFDPLAIILILAANNSLKWEREEKKPQQAVMTDEVTETTDDIEQKALNDGVEPVTAENLSDAIKDQFDLSKHKYLFKTPDTRHPPGVEPVGPQVFKHSSNEDDVPHNVADYRADNYSTRYNLLPTTIVIETNSEDTSNTVEKIKFYEDQSYVHYNGKLTSINALKAIRPDLVFKNSSKNTTIVNFGTEFPKEAFNGEFYIRTDSVPNKVYVFDSKKWVSIDKKVVTDYTHSVKYIMYLISQLEANKYKLEYLTDGEQAEISNYLKNN